MMLSREPWSGLPHPHCAQPLAGAAPEAHGPLVGPTGAAAGGCQLTAPLEAEDELSVQRRFRGTLMATAVNMLIRQKVTVGRLIKPVSINGTLYLLSRQK